MSEVIDFGDVNDVFPRAFLPLSSYSGPFLPSGNHLDVYFLPRERYRITAPFVFNGEAKLQQSIDVLPDECLYEIFRRLPGSKERSVCACVSKQWLMLLISISHDEKYVGSEKPVIELKSDEEAVSAKLGNKHGDDCSIHAESEEQEGVDSGSHGYLSKSIEGRKATDVRLASIAIGTAGRGGLGKLSIRGSKASRGLTNLGLKAIAHGCPSLKALSLWNLSSIGDEGLSEIARGCRFLEKLDISHCPAITDRALFEIATQCPSLTSVTIESCSKIGDQSLKALGSYCLNLKYVSIQSCPLVTDQGIASLFSSAGKILEKAKLQALNISDVSMAVIGHYGTALLDLSLASLHSVNERGFWVMGKAKGLQRLKSLSIASCNGASDSGLQAVSEGCTDLKVFSLCNCPNVSDCGLMAFTKAAESLEVLKIESCNGITQYGVLGVLANCGQRLRTLSLENCLGFKDLGFMLPSSSSCCLNLRSLTVANCPGFGNSGLSMFVGRCPKLTHLNLSGLSGVTDAGILPLVSSSEVGLVKVSLSGCHNVTDNSITTIAELHGLRIEALNLDGCRSITDTSLKSVAQNCMMLSELDVSHSGITDSGITTLAAAMNLNLQVFSLQGCSSVTDKSLQSLVALGGALVGLNVKHCCGISSGVVDVLLDYLWRCDVNH